MAFAIASILFFSACTKSETGNGGNDELEFHHITLNAGSVSDKDESAESTSSKSFDGDDTDGVATKAIFAESVKSNTDFYWQTSDKIGVLASGSESLYPLTLESRSTNLKTATFGGDIKGTLGGYAVYPYNENHKISGNTLTYHLPSEYDFSLSNLDVDYLDSSDNVDSYKTSANPPLLAKIASGDSESSATCEFKQLGGVLCIKIDKRDVSVFDITIIADRQISGDFNVDLNSSEPVIKTTSDATADADVIGTDNYVTIKGRQTDLNKSCVCYIPMPIGEYNLKVKLSYVTANYGKWDIVSSVKSLQINRCNIKRASLTSSTLYKNGGYMLVNGIKYIDLGLPSGKLWATTNVGATLPADYGNFYNWTDANSALGSKKCSIPTRDECNELINESNTERSAVTLTNSNGETKNAMKFTSKTNGNSIYFPFTGYYMGGYGYQHENEVGSFWLSTPDDIYIAILSVQVDHANNDKNRAETDSRAEKTGALITLRPIVTP